MPLDEEQLYKKRLAQYRNKKKRFGDTKSVQRFAKKYGITPEQAGTGLPLPKEKPANAAAIGGMMGGAGRGQKGGAGKGQGQAGAGRGQGGNQGGAGQGTKPPAKNNGGFGSLPGAIGASR